MLAKIGESKQMFFENFSKIEVGERSLNRIIIIMGAL